MNTNRQHHDSSYDAAEAHQGVERLGRAFENLAARVEAGNERLQRAILEQRMNSFEFADAANQAQQAAWEQGRGDASAQDTAAAADERAQLAALKAWQDAYRETPVEEISDPFEMHKRIWLDGIAANDARG